MIVEIYADVVQSVQRAAIFSSDLLLILSVQNWQVHNNIPNLMM